MAIDVAIVEDDPHVRKTLAEWIARAPDFRLLAKWGAAESAVSRLEEFKPHVVLMDINLPGMSGVEAVKRLKPGLPNTQFVMLTVYEDEDHIYTALAAGATGYLLKQTPREELIAALQDVHRGGTVSELTSIPSVSRPQVTFIEHWAVGKHPISPFLVLGRTGQPILILHL